MDIHNKSIALVIVYVNWHFDTWYNPPYLHTLIDDLHWKLVQVTKAGVLFSPLMANYTRLLTLVTLSPSEHGSRDISSGLGHVSFQSIILCGQMELYTCPILDKCTYSIDSWAIIFSRACMHEQKYKGDFVGVDLMRSWSRGTMIDFVGLDFMGRCQEGFGD